MQITISYYFCMSPLDSTVVTDLSWDCRRSPVRGGISGEKSSFGFHCAIARLDLLSFHRSADS